MNRLLFLAIWMTSLAWPDASQPTMLEVGIPVERSILAGAADTFEIRLDAGQTALVEIEERGIGVDVTVTDRNGDTIAQASTLRATAPP